MDDSSSFMNDLPLLKRKYLLTFNIPANVIIYYLCMFAWKKNNCM